MSKPVTLHPAHSEPEVRFDQQLGEEVINAAGVVAMMKAADTPQAKRLYRLYLAEYRATTDHHLSQSAREGQALLAAMRRAGLNVTEQQR